MLESTYIFFVNGIIDLQHIYTSEAYSLYYQDS